MNGGSQPIRYEVVDGVATVTFDRPDKLNAFTRPMVQQFIGLLDRADADDAVRAVIVTGSGRAFCAGADLSAHGRNPFENDGLPQDPTAGDDAIPRDWGGLVALRIFRSLKPIIAAVNGAAAGFGVTMQLPMDIRIASTTSKFAFVFARRGIVPEAASSWFLPRIVGISTALEWSLSGRNVPSEEALERGLVRSVHPPEDLLPEARRLAKELTEQSAPVSIAMTRQMLWRMLVADHPMEAHRVDSRAVYVRAGSADVREGVSSFLEKRPACFTDRVSDGVPEIFAEWVEPEYR